MATVQVSNDSIRVDVGGFDALLAFRSNFNIPLHHVKAATTDAPPLSSVFKGIRVLGTHIPGVIAAGSYYAPEGKVFWDAHAGEELVRIDLVDESYDSIIVGVDDAHSVLRAIHTSLNA